MTTETKPKGIVVFDRSTGPLGDRLIQLQIRVIDMQLKHFPEGTVDSLLKHLAHEVGETRTNPQDQDEWGDMLILLLGAAWRQKHSPWDLVNFALHKMSINENRNWPAQPDAHGIYHHKE
jgi:hypothetical protein